MMGYGPEEANTVVELTYNYGVESYEKGNAYGQVQLTPEHCSYSDEDSDYYVVTLGMLLLFLASRGAGSGTLVPQWYREGERLRTGTTYS